MAAGSSWRADASIESSVTMIASTGSGAAEPRRVRPRTKAYGRTSDGSPAAS